ncbi:hypothetical protein [Reichenbachiella sp.]|uniref:hypothetical protein n=1 Tax=Reichenbachiella sp. TaxID=2184521 RepID=UPI003BAE1FEA
MAIWKTYQNNSKGQSMTQAQSIGQSRSGSNAVGLIDNRPAVASPIHSVIQRAEPTIPNHLRNGAEKALLHTSNALSWIGDAIDGYGIEVSDTEPKARFSDHMLWSVRFKMTGRNAHSFSGSIVQQVKLQVNYVDPQGKSQSKEGQFYEAWQVRGGRVFDAIDSWTLNKDTFQGLDGNIQNVIIWGNLHLSKKSPANLGMGQGRIPISGDHQYSAPAVNHKDLSGVEHRRYARCYFHGNELSGTVAGSDNYDEKKFRANLQDLSQEML